MPVQIDIVTDGRCSRCREPAILRISLIPTDKPQPRPVLLCDECSRAFYEVLSARSKRP